MIRFDHVTFTYPGADRPALRDVSLHVPEGELCLVVGRTGSGKSTLLRAVNGLVPSFTGGVLHGQVTVDERSTRDHPPRELADVVGLVGQVPAAGFVTDVVEDELAYTMENLGVSADVMRRHVEEVIDLLGLQSIRRRPLATLSSGQQQRVAIGSVLTASPRVLVLDEPTSALDPGAAEDVLAALTRLVHDLGLTVLVAEHRLERVVQYADRVAVLGDDGQLVDGMPEPMMRTSPVVPPVVELGRKMGWQPLPLSVRDARRAAGDLRARLALVRLPSAPARANEPSCVEVEGLTVRYGPKTALDAVDLRASAGEVVAVMGRNGAGKSTLLAQLAGMRSPTSGSVRIDGDAPDRLPARDRVAMVALVPAEVGLLLYSSSVAEECALADRDGGLEPGTTRVAVDTVVSGLPDDRHPHRDLSEGQRLALALGIVLAPNPRVVLLDEPTRGLDYDAKGRLIVTLRRLAGSGRTVFLSTHDVELVAEVATRVVVLAEGEVVTDGPVREVVTASPMFAPQVAKIVAPEPWLTLDEINEVVA